MSEEDWVALRAVAEAIWADWWCVPNHFDTITALINKYGIDVLNECADQLKQERQG